MTYICVNKLTIIGSDDGLAPGRCQAIVWTSAGMSLIGKLRNKLQRHLRWNPYIFIQDNAFQNVDCKISGILSRKYQIFQRAAVTQNWVNCMLRPLIYSFAVYPRSSIFQRVSFELNVIFIYWLFRRSYHMSDCENSWKKSFTIGKITNMSKRYQWGLNIYAFILVIIHYFFTNISLLQRNEQLLLINWYDTSSGEHYEIIN